MRCGSCQIGVGNWGAEQWRGGRPLINCQRPAAIFRFQCRHRHCHRHRHRHRLVSRPSSIVIRQSGWRNTPPLSWTSPFQGGTGSKPAVWLPLIVWRFCSSYFLCCCPVLRRIVSIPLGGKKKRKKIVATVFTSSSLLFFAQTPCGLLERECPFPEKACMGLTLMIFHCSSFNFTLELRPNLPRNAATIAVCVDEPELELELCGMWAQLNPWAFS